MQEQKYQAKAGLQTQGLPVVIDLRALDHARDSRLMN